MLPLLPELHVRVAASHIMEKVAATGEPRAVFLKNGKLMDYPAGGAKAMSYLSRDGQGVIALEVYDHDATLEQILEDVGTLHRA